MYTLNEIAHLSIYGRVIAILMIVLFHLFDSVHKADPTAFHHLIFKATHFGSQGIHFFFFISAFFLYLKYDHISNYNVQFFSWLKKRFYKLYPTYLASIFIITGLYYIFNYQVVSLHEIIVNIIPIIRNFDGYYIHSINGNFWFLHTLIEFYLVFPLLVFLMKKMQTVIFLLFTYFLVITYIIAYTYYFSVDSNALNPYSALFINYLYDFSLGMVLAKYFKTDQVLKVNIVSLASIFFVFEGIGFYLSQTGPFGRNINDLFFSVASILFIIGFSSLLDHALRLAKSSENRLAATINFLSTKIYDIYLVHHPVIKIVLTQLNNYSTLNTVVVFAIIFPVAIINYYFARLITKVFSWEN